MRLRALLPIEDIAQASRAPAAPAAELTSVDPPPFGMLKPKLEILLSAGVESGCGPPDRTQQMTANQLGSVLLEHLDEHCHSPKYVVQYSSTRDQKETTAKGSNAYLSLSTNAPAATSPTTFLASSFVSNEFAHAMQAMRTATRTGGNLIILQCFRSTEDLKSCVVPESWTQLTNENDRVGANGASG